MLYVTLWLLDTAACNEAVFFFCCTGIYAFIFNLILVLWIQWWNHEKSIWTILQSSQWSSKRLQRPPDQRQTLQGLYQSKPLSFLPGSRAYLVVPSERNVVNSCKCFPPSFSLFLKLWWLAWSCLKSLPTIRNKKQVLWSLFTFSGLPSSPDLSSVQKHTVSMSAPRMPELWKSHLSLSSARRWKVKDSIIVEVNSQQIQIFPPKPFHMRTHFYHYYYLGYRI